MRSNLLAAIVACLIVASIAKADGPLPAPSRAGAGSISTANGVAAADDIGVFSSATGIGPRIGFGSVHFKILDHQSTRESMIMTIPPGSGNNGDANGIRLTNAGNASTSGGTIRIDGYNAGGMCLSAQGSTASGDPAICGLSMPTGMAVGDTVMQAFDDGFGNGGAIWLIGQANKTGIHISHSGDVTLTNTVTTLPTCAADANVATIVKYSKNAGADIATCVCEKASSAYAWKSVSVTGDCT